MDASTTTQKPKQSYYFATSSGRAFGEKITHVRYVANFTREFVEFSLVLSLFVEEHVIMLGAIRRDQGIYQYNLRDQYKNLVEAEEEEDQEVKLRLPWFWVLTKKRDPNSTSVIQQAIFYGHKATSAGSKEQEAINFLGKNMKNDPAFTYEETMQTAISVLQSVLQEDFKATKIELGVVKADNPVFQVLSTEEIDEQLTAIRAPLVENCLVGFNSFVFAYGQSTGFAIHHKDWDALELFRHFLFQESSLSKIYDSPESDLKLNDVFKFIGVLTFDSELAVENDDNNELLNSFYDDALVHMPPNKKNWKLGYGIWLLFDHYRTPLDQICRRQGVNLSVVGFTPHKLYKYGENGETDDMLEYHDTFDFSQDSPLVELDDDFLCTCPDGEGILLRKIGTLRLVNVKVVSGSIFDFQTVLLGALRRAISVEVPSSMPVSATRGLSLEPLRALSARAFSRVPHTASTVAEEWLENVIQVLDQIDCTDAERLGCVTFLLQGDTHRWCKSFNDGMRREIHAYLVIESSEVFDVLIDKARDVESTLGGPVRDSSGKSSDNASF
ncbi:Proteasome subunit alpha type-6 [Hibiscus syriacus]|uniref:Proteasome subunit alpha type-6 n=1 Tax=Hibiscus syriacus TaxID=106335 RepID=A0A6A2YQ09_HIBSY|nr:Proteasome subunit alpha type-6 [Hibiscus syriacus]